MPRKKIIDKEIEEAVVRILAHTSYALSIKGLTKKLDDEYNIKRSPQVVLRHLEKLEKEGKIKEI